MFRPLGVIFRLSLGNYFTSQPEDDPQGSKHVVVVTLTYVVLTEISMLFITNLMIFTMNSISLNNLFCKALGFFRTRLY